MLCLFPTPDWAEQERNDETTRGLLLLSVLAAYGQQSLYIDTTLPNAHPLKKELVDKLKQSGKVKIVTLPEKADLVLDLEETRRSLGTCTAGIFVDCGHRGRAVLKSRYSGEELWSEEKGGGWQWAGWSAAAVGRKLGDDLSKFLAEQTPAARSAESAGAPSSATSSLVAAFGMLARTSEDPDAQGVEIMDVADDGPAKAAGLRTGYVINAIDGKRIKNDQRPPGPVEESYRKHHLACRLHVPYKSRLDGKCRDGDPSAYRLAQVIGSPGSFGCAKAKSSISPLLGGYRFRNPSTCVPK